jgi:hypothetical protein
MNNDNPQVDAPRTAIEGAIDRAVERRMRVDPPPGLQRRVLARLRAPRTHASLFPRLALGVGGVAIVMAAVLLVPRNQPRREPVAHNPPEAALATRAPQPAAGLTSSSAKEAAPRPIASAAAAPTSRPARQRSKTTDTEIKMPNVANVFGERSAKVSAASVPGADQAKPEVPAAPAPKAPRTPAQLANIRLDVTITEQRDGAAIPPRTVTMLLADRENGHVRTLQGNVVLNVDARPDIVRDGRIRVFFMMEYRIQTAEGERSSPPLLNESVTSLLEDGKPAVVSQSADPTSARSAVRVELKATIVK